ncbi:MAG: bifunctional folylpolyglutamate synthase/dihydrofolate synthase [Acetatifactor sp.]
MGFLNRSLYAKNFRMEFTMKYKEALEYLEETKKYGIVPGLGNIRNLMEGLGNPQKELRFVHLAGTNGKGSVLAYLSTVLMTAGYRVGRYSSPVVSCYREHIQVNGRNIPQNAFASCMERIKNVCENLVQEGQPHPTVFEIETALAILYFRDKACDIVVMEAGMGGLSDATNVIENTLVAILTSIGMDHMQFLGDTLEKIAAQKAGIIKPGCRVVMMDNVPEVVQVVKREADAKGAALTISDASGAKNIHYGLKKQTFDYAGLKKLEIHLAGKFQVNNAVLAVDAVQLLRQAGVAVPDKAIREGLKATVWEGRFQVLSEHPLFVTDGAHNEDAARKLADSIDFYFTNRRIVYIMGMLRDKEVGRVIELTHHYADQIITVTPSDNPRAMHAYDLAQEVRKYHPNVTAVDSLEEAVEVGKLLCGKDDVLLAFGSLSFQGKLISMFQKGKQQKGN